MVTFHRNKVSMLPTAGRSIMRYAVHSAKVPPHLMSSLKSRATYFVFETDIVRILSLIPMPRPNLRMYSLVVREGGMTWWTSMSGK